MAKITQDDVNDVFAPIPPGLFQAKCDSLLADGLDPHFVKMYRSMTTRKVEQVLELKLIWLSSGSILPNSE